VGDGIGSVLAVSSLCRHGGCTVLGILIDLWGISWKSVYAGVGDCAPVSREGVWGNVTDALDCDDCLAC
jgi:Rieske Fe-S protein